MIVYIAGPMTGFPDLNYPAFNAAEEALTAAGHAVVNVPLARRMPTDNQIAELARLVHERDQLRAEVGA